MGTRNANRCGGLDRPEAAQVIGGVVPEGLVKRLDAMVGWEPADSPRAAAIKEAADVLRHLPTRQSDEKRLDDPLFLAKGYRIDTDDSAKQMRVVVFGEHGNKRVLSYSLLEANEAYEMASAILKNYDTLEGIK